ncbi:hypothetical protein RHMOL_Rhmol02G0190600 [Rhododendron molle]|uniref:Uncharacterized protein n=1 Tax=Rhododendron molle TaxID=49168 RepID=A0ACC0PUX4_RHOML|nr:hypothetical protein RHMOL_Rhmol02G0190600 [Rhododendron molle]
MEFNHMRMVELGYHKMADALFGSNKKRKIKNMRARGNLSDEDYLQPEDAPEDEDNDDDTFSYTDDEELLPVEQDGLSATPSSLPQQMVRAFTSRRVRGANRGINTERLIAGGSGKKLNVEIPLEVGAPIGENATRFATWLGIQIRMAAPLKNVEKWDDIPFHVKKPIIQATQVKFSFNYYFIASSVFSNIPPIIPALLDIAYQSRTLKETIESKRYTWLINLTPFCLY